MAQIPQTAPDAMEMAPVSSDTTITALRSYAQGGPVPGAQLGSY